MISGESVYFTEGEIAPRVACVLRLSRAFLTRRIRGPHSGGWISHRDGSRAGSREEWARSVVIGVHLSRACFDSAPRNTIEVISRSFSIIQTAATQPWRSETDVLIEPNVHHVLWDEFAKTPQLVAAGEAATREVVPQIKELIALSASQRVQDRGDSTAAATSSSPPKAFCRRSAGLQAGSLCLGWDVDP